MNSLAIGKCAILFVTISFAAFGQDKELPSALSSLQSAQGYSTVVQQLPDDMLLGYNWGNPISKFSDECDARLFHKSWNSATPWTLNSSTLSASGIDFRDHSSNSTSKPIYLIPHVRSGNIAPTSCTGIMEIKCLKYEPEIDVQLSQFASNSSASPGAAFGFRVKDGKVTSNGTHIELKATKFGVSTQTPVLSNVWPDSAFMMRFASIPTQVNPGDANDDWSGKKMLVAINLRRPVGSNQTLDNSKVLEVRVKYTQLNGTTGYLRFSDVSSSGNFTPLNANDPTFGLQCEEAPLSSLSDKFEIARKCIPQNNTSVTLYGVVEFARDVLHYSPQSNNLPLIAFYEEPQPMTIVRLDVEVDYVTHSTSSDDLDLEIDWVKLETPGARDFFSGVTSSSIVSEHKKFIEDVSNLCAITGRQYRLAYWYNYDEPVMMYWEGIRNLNLLLDKRTTTEINLDYGAHLNYKVEMPALWQGHTVKMTPGTAVPFYLNGYYPSSASSLVADQVNYPSYRNKHFFLGVSKGISSVVGWDDIKYWEGGNQSNHASPPSDYETAWGSKPSISSPATLYSIELPIEDNLYLNGLVIDQTTLGQNVAGSVQCAIEGVLARYRIHSDFLFLTNAAGKRVPWYSNIWNCSEWNMDVNGNKPDPCIVNNLARPICGTEFYLMTYLQLTLGSKGLIQYYAVSDHPTSPANANVNAPHLGTIGALSVGTTSLTSSTAVPTTTGTTFVTDAVLGSDFLSATILDEPTRVSSYMFSSSNSTATPDLHFFADKLGVADDRLYVGRQSNRLAQYRVNKFVTLHAETLKKLELQSWWAHGYRSWTENGNTNVDIQKFVKLDQDLKAGHPDRRNLAGEWENESIDSVFMDITLHKHADSALTDRFFIAVCNRRTDPRIFNTMTNQYEFKSEVEHEQAVASNAITEFSQKGARKVVLPFNYVDPSGKPCYLHVSELKPDASASGIDVVIPQNGTVSLTLRPGHAAFLRVEVLPATEQTKVGFLDHSNQRKLVAFPKVDHFDIQNVPGSTPARQYQRMIAGDRMWYHSVYHKNRLVGINQMVTVYYRRSKEILYNRGVNQSEQYLFDATKIEWEDEIEVSRTVDYQNQELSLSCAYPSLVVRGYLDQSGQVVSNVYIVYGCEYQENSSMNILICESVFPAEQSNANQKMYVYNNPQVHLGHGVVFDKTAVPAGTLGSPLASWGTPMINASQSGNYYCWSKSQSGIGIAFKRPEIRLLPPNQISYVRFNPGKIASHPSLNSYSRLYLGEDDASLVWQEGATTEGGENILYTRLFNDGPVAPATSDVTNRPSPNIGNLGRLFAGAPFQNFPAMASILRVSNQNDIIPNSTPAQFTSTYSFPVVYRQLSDWEIATPDVNGGADLTLLHQVHNVCDRIFYQGKLNEGPDTRWRVWRRAVDVHDWSATTPASIDEIWSMAPHFIRSDMHDLLGPDVVAGTQWGDPTSNPQNSNANYGDSSTVLNFWAQLANGDPNAAVWDMHYGWNYYGLNADHTMQDLQTSLPLLSRIKGNGLYPHLAAKHSHLDRRNWNVSRRLYESPGANRTGFAVAPFMTSSSEYFYKINDDYMPRTFRYGGYRGNEHWVSVSSIVCLETATAYPLAGDSLKLKADRTSYQLVTAWMDIAPIGNYALAAINRGDNVASLYIERQSTGELIELSPTADPSGLEKRYSVLTLLGGDNDKYRFVLIPNEGDMYQVEDIELMIPGQPGDLFRASTNNRQIVNLATQKAVVSTGHGTVWAYPDPASSSLSIVVNISRESERKRSGQMKGQPATITVYDQLGQVVFSKATESIDIVSVDVTDWAPGAYNVVVVVRDLYGRETRETGRFQVMN